MFSCASNNEGGGPMDHRGTKKHLSDAALAFETSGQVPKTADGQINRELAAYSDNANAS